MPAIKGHKKGVTPETPTIVVIGHLVWDRIVKADGTVAESFGGIAYNLAALSTIARNQVRIVPVCLLGDDKEVQARRFLASLPGVVPNHAKAVPYPTEAHELIYDVQQRRREVNLHPFPRIGKRLFRGLERIDLALVNYIGGREFPPRLVRWLKSRYLAVIYMDFHSLALGMDASGNRFLRRHPQWRRYVTSADIIQMNHHELRVTLGIAKDDTDSIVNGALMLVSLGPRIVIVTREAQDLVIVTRQGNRKACKRIPVHRAPKVVDTTGCGDSFAAGMAYAICLGLDPFSGCRLGLSLAARKATFSGVDGFEKSTEDGK